MSVRRRFAVRPVSARGKAIASALFNAAILLLLAVWLRGAVLLMGVNAGAIYVSKPWLRVAHLYAIKAASIVLTMVFLAADLARHISFIRTRAAGSCFSWRSSCWG